MLLLSSSLICLNFSACLSYFSINPWFNTDANSADFFKAVIALADSIAFFIFTFPNSFTTTSPAAPTSATASTKLVATSFPASRAAAPTSKIFVLVSMIERFNAFIVSGFLSPKKLFSHANIAVSIPS